MVCYILMVLDHFRLKDLIGTKLSKYLKPLKINYKTVNLISKSCGKSN